MFNDEAVIIWENLCSSFRERTGHSMDTNPDSMNKKERKDFERCVTLMTKAAKLGNLDAASFLGYLYERGVMYEKNYKLSAYWFSVCENENPPRRQQCQHGILYITGGYGLSVDRSRGKDLLQLSSLQGDDFAQCILGTLLRDSEIKEERDEALRLLLESATQGNDRSLCDLGIIQYEGIIVTRSYTKAFQLFMKASNLGSPLARYLISGCYLRGHGVRQSDEQAARWLRAAEEIGEDHVREYANNMFQTQSSNDSRRLNVSI
jgi:TPR repeat protein